MPTAAVSLTVTNSPRRISSTSTSSSSSSASTCSSTFRTNSKDSPPSSSGSDSGGGKQSEGEGGWRRRGTTTTATAATAASAGTVSRFKLSKLLHLPLHHQSSRSEQNEVQPPLSPRQQHYQYLQQQSLNSHSYHAYNHHGRPQHQHHDHGRQHRSKYHSSAARFRRGNFFGFLQSYYHVFHRQLQDSTDPATDKDASLAHSSFDGDSDKDIDIDRDQDRDGHSKKPNAMTSPRLPVRSMLSSLQFGRSNGNTKTNYKGGGKNMTPPTLAVHPGYNATISDFRPHATIDSTLSDSPPTKITEIIFDQHSRYAASSSAAAIADSHHHQLLLELQQPQSQDVTSSLSTTIPSTTALVVAAPIGTNSSNTKLTTHANVNNIASDSLSPKEIVTVTTTITDTNTNPSLFTPSSSSPSPLQINSNNNADNSTKISSGLKATLRPLSLLSGSNKNSKSTRTPQLSSIIPSSFISSVTSSTVTTEPIVLPSRQNAVPLPSRRTRRSKTGPPLPLIQQQQQQQLQGQGSDQPSLPSTSTSFSSPSKHITRALEAGAKKIGLLKKKRTTIPTHYLSLPVGGIASAAVSEASGMYALHSEDLSVTEFAKLAGITILPDIENDSDNYNSVLSSFQYHNVDDTIASNSVEEGADGSSGSGHPSTGESSSSGSSHLIKAMIPGSDSGNTMDSDRQLTTDSMISNQSFLRKVNIWDPQFWTNPRDGITGTTGAFQAVSRPSSSPPILLSTMSVSSSAPPSPMFLPMAQMPFNIPALVRQPPTPAESDNDNIVWSSGDSKKVEDDWSSAKTSAQVRRNSFTSDGLCSGDGAEGGTLTTTKFKRERARTTSGTSITLRRVDEMPNPPKDAAELSRDLTRRCPFTSLTAVAIELGGSEQETQQREGPANRSEASLNQARGNSTTHLEPSLPDQAIVPSRSQQQQRSHPHHVPAHTVALHALQPSRCKNTLLQSCGSGSSSGLPRLPGGTSRNRSSSPSPLSRQINLDSPQEEKEEFDFQSSTTSEAGTSSVTGFVPTTTTVITDTTVATRSFTLNPSSMAMAMYRQRTQSLPTLFLPDPQNVAATVPASDTLSSLTASTPFTSVTPLASGSVERRPSTSTSTLASSKPKRTFEPGTKVGRFTLVKEQCTRHVDILRAQEEELRLQNQSTPSSRRISTISLMSSSSSSLAVFGPEDQEHHNIVGASDECKHGEDEKSQKEGSWMNDSLVMKSEENVVVFQRKKTRRSLPVNPQQRYSNPNPDSSSQLQ
ncbi:hypothetical protein BX616_003883 [Lobosporangium transversale]|nr:hypothetical protein BX616_003883 [Lobosporangium transversale]